MLSGSGGTASSNIQRTKSTTSVKERRKNPLQAESIDPQTARVHALIAAHRAVDRSRTNTSSDLTRSESVLSRKNTITYDGRSDGVSPASHLRRQRSTLQTRVPKLADSLNMPGRHRLNASNCDYAGYEVEFGMQKENYGAEPSSYRKLRRSRSVITPTRSLRQTCSDGSEASFSQAPTLRTAASSGALRSPGLKLRLKRSLNFLRQSPRTADRIVTAPAQLQPQEACSLEAIALARSQYWVTPDKQNPVKRGLVSLSSGSKRAHKPLRKSFHTEGPGGDDAITQINSTNQALKKSQKRLISTSLSDKLKKMLRISKQAECLPPQQMTASRAHFDIDSALSNPEDGFDRYLDSDTATPGRKSLYSPSYSHPQTSEDVAQLSQRLSQSGSCESLSSNSKSRVTSWTNSTTTTNSTAIHPSGYEPKRLSVIKEDGGPHQPSSSAGRHMGGISTFQQPLNIPHGQTVDSQRVYSALLKRIDEEQKEMEKTQAALKEIHDVKDQDDVVGHYLFSTPTIRRVRSNGSTSLADIKEDTTTTIVDQLTPCSSKFNKDIPQGKRKPWQQGSDLDLRLLPKLSHPEGKESFDHPIRSRDKLQVHDAPKGRGVTDIYLGSSRFGQSTDSIYSRTTNGGTNLDYASPLASTEDLDSQASIAADMATILNPAYFETNTRRNLLVPSRSRLGLDAAEKGAWKGWMEQQISNLGQNQAQSKSVSHVREHAQINEDDTDVGYCVSHGFTPPNKPESVPIQESNLAQAQVILESSSKHTLNHTTNSYSVQSKSPQHELTEVPRNQIPTLNRSKIRKCHQMSSVDQKTTVQSSCEDEGKASKFHKITPGNVAKMLKASKSHNALCRLVSIGKENKPIFDEESPPISTPGRLQKQVAYTNSAGQLRVGKSAVGLENSSSVPNVDNHDDLYSNSLSNQNRSNLPFRLSRPFDMDIPERNRPFDSTFLGKREAGNGSRLSVAATDKTVRRRKTYGDLGPPPFTMDEELDNSDNDEDRCETTALPRVCFNNSPPRSVSGSSWSLAGKKLVNGLLRNRKKSAQDDPASSPTDGNLAFI